MIRLRLIVGVLVATIALSGCASSSKPNDPNELGFVSADGSAVLKDSGQRSAVIDLAFPVIDSTGQWSVSDSRGKVIVLNVWGPWCAPCRKEFPELQKLSSELSTDGLEIVGVATRSTDTAVSTFVKSQGITFRQVADFDSLIMSGLSGVPSSTVPSSVLIDRQGRIAGWVLGAADPVLLKSLLKSLLEETP
jgi:hypothetical protein